jgi:hypothetical protein
VTETPQRVEITAGRRIGMGMVDTVTRLRRVDDSIAGRELESPVERELRATAQLLHGGAYTDQVGRALLSVLTRTVPTCRMGDGRCGSTRARGPPSRAGSACRARR